jgi:hypothetical protein
MQTSTSGAIVKKHKNSKTCGDKISKNIYKMLFSI